MKKLIPKIAVVTVLPLLLLIVIAASAVAAAIDEAGDGNPELGSGPGQYTGTNPSVLAYQDAVTGTAAQYGMNDFVGLILAVIDQESGGQGNDPMQAAEGEFNTLYPHEPNGITDPTYSIICGIQELKKALQIANSADGKTYDPYGALPSAADIPKISLALQGYNYGIGWFSFAGGTYTAEKAQEFSNKMAAQMGWEQYGDPLYVPHVLEFYSTAESSTGVFAWPVPGHTTLSDTFHPDSGSRVHKGIDISDGSINGAPIVAAQSGQVIQAGFGVSGSGYGGYGNVVAIDHGNGIVTLYGHMSSVACTAGTSIQQGQVIGYVGTTGQSTGPHLHFEVRVNGNPVDPMGYLQGGKT